MFAPDLVAVLDAGKPPDTELPAWVVADEGRGLDFALEVHYTGDRHKDLVENVALYARLGIPEYFFFDRRDMRLYGWELPDRNARTYRRKMPQGGRFASLVLGLEIALVEGKLKFMLGTADVPDAADLSPGSTTSCSPWSHDSKPKCGPDTQRSRRATSQNRRARRRNRHAMPRRWRGATRRCACRSCSLKSSG